MAFNQQNVLYQCHSFSIIMLLIQHDGVLHRKTKDFCKMFILNLYLQKKLFKVLEIFCIYVCLEILS